MIDYIFFALSSAVLLINFFALRGGSERQTSMLLTLISSIVIFIDNLIGPINQSYNIPSPPPDRALIIFFLAYLISDTLLALTIYPKKKLQCIMLHHGAYIALCLFLLKNGMTNIIDAAALIKILVFFVTSMDLSVFILPCLMCAIYSEQASDSVQSWIMAAGPILVCICQLSNLLEKYDYEITLKKE